MKCKSLAVLIALLGITVANLGLAQPTKGKNVGPKLSACRSNSDCTLLPSVCPTCAPCTPWLRTVGSTERLQQIRSIQARIRCAPPKCKPCSKAANWLPTEAICRRGGCEALPARPVVHPSKERACKRNRDCVLAPRSPCGCPNCGIHWRRAVNRKAAAKLRNHSDPKKCPKVKCAPCKHPESKLIGSGAACQKGQCIVKP